MCLVLNVRFASGNEVTGHSVLIHDFYSRYDPFVVHVTMDTTLKSGQMELKAFVKLVTVCVLPILYMMYNIVCNISISWISISISNIKLIIFVFLKLETHIPLNIIFNFLKLKV